MAGVFKQNDYLIAAKKHQLYLKWCLDHSAVYNKHRTL